MPEWLTSCLSTMDRLAAKVALERVEEPLDQRDLLPPPNARAWIGPHAVVLVAPVELADGWDPQLASRAARWVGDVIDQWWKRGRVLDAYVVLVSPSPPGPETDRDGIDEWHGRTHICRRRVVWREPGTTDWEEALEGLPFLPVPVMDADFDESFTLPALPERMAQLLGWVTGDGAINNTEAAQQIQAACDEVSHAR